MTVTKRKAINRDPNEERVPSQTGVSYACDVCSADISHTVRIRCAQVEEQRPTCEDFDLCGSCFVGGKEVGRHRRWHDYRVVEPHAYPIFNNDWGADEELLLIDACQQYGLGNWMDIAEHIGSFRSKAEVEQHYYDTYLKSPHFPLPAIHDDLDPDQDRFQQRKKARLEAAQTKPPVVPPPKPGPSVPVCHEVGGFMPARLEFEHEFDNEAEVLIKDMEFGLVMRYGGSAQPKAPESEADEDEVKVKQEETEVNTTVPPSQTPQQSQSQQQQPPPPAAAGAPDAAANATEALVEEDEEDLDLKLAILDIYNERINKRIEIKSLIFDRNLVDYRKNQANDKKRTKEEKDLIMRNKPFARIQTRLDHEAYMDGLLYEATLRKRIAELQEYRRAGLTNLDEVEKYEKDKQTHFAQLAKGTGREWARLQKQALARQGLTRAATGPLSLATASSLSLLTNAEVEFCSRERLMPKPFLFIKTHLVQHFASQKGSFGLDQAKALFSQEDVHTQAVVSRVWHFLNGTQETEVKIEEADEEGPSITTQAMELDEPASSTQSAAQETATDNGEPSQSTPVPPPISSAAPNTPPIVPQGVNGEPQ